METCAIQPDVYDIVGNEKHLGTRHSGTRYLSNKVGDAKNVLSLVDRRGLESMTCHSGRYWGSRRDIRRLNLCVFTYTHPDCTRLLPSNFLP